MIEREELARILPGTILIHENYGKVITLAVNSKSSSSRKFIAIHHSHPRPDGYTHTIGGDNLLCGPAPGNDMEIPLTYLSRFKLSKMEQGPQLSLF